MSSDALLEEIKAVGLTELEGLLVAIGEHHVSGRTIAQKVARRLRGGDGDEQLPSIVRTGQRRRPKSSVGVHVEGLDDVMVRLSRCCTPVPGDEIIGFVTRGRGVSVHRADCANASSLASVQEARLIEVDWDSDGGAYNFVAAVEVKALDRSRLLRDVANALSDQHVNIVSCSTHTGSDRIAKMRFEFELADPNHLESVLRTIKTIDAVYDAYRVVPGKGA
jgi:GTP pyrophosphokinase